MHQNGHQNEHEGAYEAPWMDELWSGSIQAIGHFRRLLLSGKELTQEDREAMVSMYNDWEEHLIVVAEVVKTCEDQEKAELRRLSALANERIRNGEV